MKIYVVGLIVLILVSCNEVQKQEVQTITMEELMGDVDGINLDSTNQDNVDIIQIDNSPFSYLIESLSNYDTALLNTGHPIDRYGFNTSKKIEFIGKENVPYGKTTMVTPKAEFYVYHFSDSLKLNNAFYNWLDCYGSDCNEVKLYENIESIKTAPSFTVIYDTTLISVKYLCEHKKNDWKAFQDSILNKYGDNYRYLIDVRCGGPLIWK